MLLQQLYIKNFRCFKEKKITFDSKLILINGVNGAGKTSLLEAMHYLCYLHSFRTHIPSELVHFKEDGFFIKGRLRSSLHVNHELQVGFSNKKKRVRLDEKNIASYKDLFDYYRVITLIEDDLELIKGPPAFRRSFIDRVILLRHPEFLKHFRHFKQIVERRNALLSGGSCTHNLYEIWTQQLLDASSTIQQARIKVLAELEFTTNDILRNYFDLNIRVSFSYKIRKPHVDSLSTCFEYVYNDELRYGKTIFGSHLDDFVVSFCGLKSKQFASRGQQKLIILLIKIAQIKQLFKIHGDSIFLIDDFMTDFDFNVIEIALSVLLSLKNQLIFTAPLEKGPFVKEIVSKGAGVIRLTE